MNNKNQIDAEHKRLIMKLLTDLIDDQPELMEAIEVQTRKWNKRTKGWEPDSNSIVVNLTAAIYKMNQMRDQAMTANLEITDGNANRNTNTIKINALRILQNQGLSAKHSEALTRTKYQDQEKNAESAPETP
jgi:hypothetical protein